VEDGEELQVLREELAELASIAVPSQMAALSTQPARISS